MKRNRKEYEGALLEIWKSILEHPNIMEDDNFFDVGGTSITIVRMSFLIKEQLYEEIRVIDLFNYTTIRRLADFFYRKNIADNEN